MIILLFIHSFIHCSYIYEIVNYEIINQRKKCRFTNETRSFKSAAILITFLNEKKKLLFWLLSFIASHLNHIVIVLRSILNKLSSFYFKCRTWIPSVSKSLCIFMSVEFTFLKHTVRLLIGWLLVWYWLSCKHTPNFNKI